MCVHCTVLHHPHPDKLVHSSRCPSCLCSHCAPIKMKQWGLVGRGVRGEGVGEVGGCCSQPCLSSGPEDRVKCWTENHNHDITTSQSRLPLFPLSEVKVSSSLWTQHSSVSHSRLSKLLPSWWLLWKKSIYKAPVVQSRSGEELQKTTFSLCLQKGAFIKRWKKWVGFVGTLWMEELQGLIPQCPVYSTLPKVLVGQTFFFFALLIFHVQPQWQIFLLGQAAADLCDPELRSSGGGHRRWMISPHI